MFLRRIFSRPAPPEPTAEKLTLDSLQKRIADLKEEKIEKIRPQLITLLEKTNKICVALSGSLKELYKSDPDEEVHPGLIKTATEARKLFYEKTSRALTYLEFTQEFTADSLPKINEKFSKATNIIAEAMKAHGRYVRAVFVKKYSELELHLRKLNEITTQVQSTLNSLIGELKVLGDLNSEISIYRRGQLEIDKIKENITLLQENVGKLAADIDELTSQLARLKESSEFIHATESVEELNKTWHEINKEREIAAGLVSELSRPFRKLERFLKTGEYQMPQEIRRTLEICINNPVEIISSDENLTTLEKLLHETVTLANSGKLNLDKREIKNLTAARFLPSRLRNIKNNLDSLVQNAKAKKEDSKSPLLDQALKLENLIKKLEKERKEALVTAELLEKRARTMQEELASRKNYLQKLASEILGSRVEITF